MKSLVNKWKTDKANAKKYPKYFNKDGKHKDWEHILLIEEMDQHSTIRDTCLCKPKVEIGPEVIIIRHNTMEEFKTEYEYIRFINRNSFKGKTTQWYCMVKGSPDTWLGMVKWYSGWRQYCYFPEAKTIYNKGCLTDINHFIKQLMDERKK